MNATIPIYAMITIMGFGFFMLASYYIGDKTLTLLQKITAKKEPTQPKETVEEFFRNNAPKDELFIPAKY